MPKSTRPTPSRLPNYIDATKLSSSDIVRLRERGSGANKPTTLEQLDAYFTFDDAGSDSGGSSSAGGGGGGSSSGGGGGSGSGSDSGGSGS